MGEEALTQEEVVERLHKAALPWDRVKLIKQLASLGRRDSLPVLADMLRDPDEVVRLTALQAIRGVGGPGAVDVLIGALRHEDQTTAAWAALRLQQLNYQFSGPEILAVAEERWPSLNDQARRTFLTALTPFGQPDAIPLLKVGVVSSDRTVRHHSANALAYIRSTESREVLDWALGELSAADARAVRKGMRRHGPLERLKQRAIRRIVDR
jgi:HEAT repeat protein